MHSSFISTNLWNSEDLFVGWDLSGAKKPEETLRKGFLTTWSLGEYLLTFWDAVATEADTFLWIKDRGFSDKTLDATHTTVHLEINEYIWDIINLKQATFEFWFCIITVDVYTIQKIIWRILQHTMSTVTSPTLVPPCLERNSLTVCWCFGIKLASSAFRSWKDKSQCHRSYARKWTCRKETIIWNNQQIKITTIEGCKTISQH